MFASEIYQNRRAALIARLDRGIVVLPGNAESPMNYADNCYPFRQDSTFLYYCGLDQPDLAAVIDVDQGATTLFGDELTVEQIVWTGVLPTIRERAERVGISDTRPRRVLAEVVSAARAAGRSVMFLPTYRADTTALVAALVGRDPADVAAGSSVPLIKAVVDQRAHKSDEEIAEIERAVATSVAMHEAAVRMARPGVTERRIAAEVQRIADGSGGRLSFPVIGTINGQTLHNHSHVNTLSEGRLYLLDAGAETEMGYAGDLTTTVPVASAFTAPQRAIYEILLRAYEAAAATLAPGVKNRDVHLAAARTIFEGMKSLKLMKGGTDEAVAAGAHALVFPHGIGHMMGLDVHDMENLGEDYVGYAGEERSTQFGLKSLRLARRLEPGFVLTVEPGIYFIPQLIDDWRSRKQCAQFINYDAFDRWRDFGGMRNEENYLITADGARRLGPRKPQTAEEYGAIRGA
jgi:Xaa-Pro aminopeptidase